jgi:NAD(P)-dependent dehydrogenase (short-subunit alcohol dehydrogenase family)
MTPYRPRTALITGGGSGIGAALAKQLMKGGTSVVVADVNVEMTKKVTGPGGSTEAIKTDVSDRAQVEALFRTLKNEYGPLDLVVNCAGISCYGESSDIPPALWDRVLNVNLRGTIDVSLAAAALMRTTGGGSIVNIASMSAFLIPPLFGPYVASKAAIIGFSRALAIESEIHGIRVSVACPGNVRTPMLGAWKQSFLTPSISPEDAAKRILKGVAERRTMIVFPMSTKVFWYLDRLSPGLLNPFRREILRRARGRK